DEAVGDRPASGDLIQTAITDIQRPSTDAIERRARDVVTSDVRTEQAVRLILEPLVPWAVRRDDKGETFAVVDPCKREGRIRQGFRHPDVRRFWLQPRSDASTLPAIGIAFSLPFALDETDDGNHYGCRAGPRHAFLGEMDRAVLNNHAEADLDGTALGDVAGCEQPITTIGSQQVDGATMEDNA